MLSVIGSSLTISVVALAQAPDTQGLDYQTSHAFGKTYTSILDRNIVR
jgi:hypothetical protein